MKGQIFSLDLMFAVVIILIIISGLALIALQYTAFHDREVQNRDLELKTQAAMNSLILTPGIPYNWENTTIP